MKCDVVTYIYANLDIISLYKENNVDREKEQRV